MLPTTCKKPLEEDVQMLDDVCCRALSKICDGKAVETSRTEAEDSVARAAPAPRPHEKKIVLQNDTGGGEQGKEDEEKAERKGIDGGARSLI